MSNKRITKTTKVALDVWIIGLFSWVWINFYNNFAFITHRFLGAVVSITIYTIVYMAFRNLYKAYRIASSTIPETVFSQILSFGIADLLLYAESCLIHNKYISIIPGLMAVVMQIAGTVVIVMFSKQYFMRWVAPKSTIIVYGSGISEGEIRLFRKRLLEKYRHLFKIEMMVDDETDIDELRLKAGKINTVILYEIKPEKRAELMEWCLDREKEYYFTPKIEDIISQGSVPKHLIDTPLYKYEYNYKISHKLFVKRLLDLVFSIITILLCTPCMLIVALLIKIEDGGPVFYKQLRLTKGGKKFNIIKFRSMIPNAEADGPIPAKDGDKRITKVGRFIRSCRIDEIPQLFNILKGDMSFVGPRPERIENVEKYSQELPEFKYRLRVRGGLTGYAQIYGKYNTSAYDKLRMDMIYIENQSIVLDLKLIFLTIRTLFQKESTEGFDK